MNQRRPAPSREDVDLVLFQVGGVRFGAQAAEVLSALPVEAAGTADLLWLHDSLGLRKDIAYRDPVALELRGETTRVVVDGLENLVRRPLSTFRPLPALIQTKALENGFWAALPDESGMVLLVDFHRLVHARPAALPDVDPLLKG